MSLPCATGYDVSGLYTVCVVWAFSNSTHQYIAAFTVQTEPSATVGSIVLGYQNLRKLLLLSFFEAIFKDCLFLKPQLRQAAWHTLKTLGVL